MSYFGAVENDDNDQCNMVKDYSKLQRDYALLEAKFNKIAADSVANKDSDGVSPFAAQLIAIVANLHGRKTYSDITVKLSDGTKPAHKFVLNARSEEWCEDVLNGTSELDWSDLESDVGSALLRWLYTDKIELNNDLLALDLLRAAYRFKLPGLLGLCERALISSVDIRSCVRFYCVAEDVNARNLLEYCSEYISTRWDDLTAQDFEHMSGPLLYKMIKSKSEYPLHFAVKLLREDVVDLCLSENIQSLSKIVNSLSPQGYLPLGLALMGRSNSIALILVQKGNANVNAVNSEGNTLLIDAIKRGDGFSAQFLIDKSCDLNRKSQATDDTALHLVCTYSEKTTDSETYKSMILVGKSLLQQGANLNLQNKKGYSPLHLAIVSGNIEMVDLLLGRTDIDTNLRTITDKCALQLSLMPPYTDGPPFKLASQLLDKGASIDQCDAETGDNLLQILITFKLEDASIFLTDYIALNRTNVNGLSALHMACEKGLKRLVKALLEKGASPNIQTVDEHKTPLQYCVEEDYGDIIQCFVDCKMERITGGEQPDFNLNNFNGDSLLSLALFLERQHLVPILIKGGADVNARNGQDLTLLHQAIQNEDAETAIFLLNNGADLNALTGNQESPLQLAIRYKLPTVVDVLCGRGVSFSAPSDNEDPPLWIALDSEQEAIAAVLVKHGVDTDSWTLSSSGFLQSLLHRAIDENNENAAVFLIKNGCDVDSPRQLGPNYQGSDKTKDTMPPLHLCCQRGLVRVMQSLIDHGANVNALGYDNKTPLHIAIENQYDEIIELLLCHPGIDLKIHDKFGSTPFATALTIRNHKAAQRILERMPNAAEQIDQRGRNYLHVAILKDDLESVLFLLSIQVDVNSRVHDINHTPPLHLAASSKNEMLIRNLILAGARINDTDSTAKTALHIAAERGNLAAVSALLQNGADFDAVDNEGNNALHIAVREGHLPVARELLTECGINAEALNLKGRNPLHELCRNGKDNTAAAICELFLECMPKYPINQTDINGNTPLLLAFIRGQAMLCKILVKNGACLGAENKEGVTIFNFKLASNQLLHKLLDQLPQESPWSTSDLCQECGQKFTITVRKHHCRHCGRMLCSKCSNNDVPILKFGLNKPVRVCSVCYEVLQVGSG